MPAPESWLAAAATMVLMAALSLPVSMTSGCGPSEEPVAEGVLPAPDKDAISKVTQNGPVKATVQVWPAKPVLSDPIYVRLTVEAEPGVAVDLPFQTGQLGESALGRFRVMEFMRSEKRTDKGHRVEEHTYQLQAQSSGRSRIPPFRLEMLDRRKGAEAGTGSGSGSDSGSGSGSATGSGSDSGSGSGSATGSGSGTGSASASASGSDPGSSPTSAPRPVEILTEEVPLEIAPIPVEKVTASLAPARGPLEVNPGQRAWWWWAALIAVTGAWIAIAVALWRRWRQRQAIARRRSAYDEAVAQLRQLEASGAPDVDTADAWFVRLSAIVRRYLESRYEIRAPELTTEEFLQVALRAAVLSAAHRALLATFLECCDRVKFAAYRPDERESLDMLAAARSFVEDTRLREPGEAAGGNAHAA